MSAPRPIAGQSALHRSCSRVPPSLALNILLPFSLALFPFPTLSQPCWLLPHDGEVAIGLGRNKASGPAVSAADPFHLHSFHATSIFMHTACLRCSCACPSGCLQVLQDQVGFGSDIAWRVQSPRSFKLLNPHLLVRLAWNTHCEVRRARGWKGRDADEREVRARGVSESEYDRTLQHLKELIKRPTLMRSAPHPRVGHTHTHSLSPSSLSTCALHPSAHATRKHTPWGSNPRLWALAVAKSPTACLCRTRKHYRSAFVQALVMFFWQNLLVGQVCRRRRSGGFKFL